MTSADDDADELSVTEEVELERLFRPAARPRLATGWEERLRETLATSGAGWDKDRSVPQARRSRWIGAAAAVAIVGLAVGVAIDRSSSDEDEGERAEVAAPSGDPADGGPADGAVTTSGGGTVGTDVVVDLGPAVAGPLLVDCGATGVYSVVGPPDGEIVSSRWEIGPMTSGDGPTDPDGREVELVFDVPPGTYEIQVLVNDDDLVTEEIVVDGPSCR